jgi:hypothetical protein
MMMEPAMYCSALVGSLVAAVFVASPASAQPSSLALGKGASTVATARVRSSNAQQARTGQ